VGTFTPPALPGFFANPLPIAESLPFASLPFDRLLRILARFRFLTRGDDSAWSAILRPLVCSTPSMTPERDQPLAIRATGPVACGHSYTLGLSQRVFRGSSDSVSYTSPRKPLPALRLSPQVQIQSGLARSFPGEVTLPDRRTISRSPAIVQCAFSAPAEKSNRSSLKETFLLYDSASFAETPRKGALGSSPGACPRESSQENPPSPKGA
jgi:hypothetical protein